MKVEGVWTEGEVTKSTETEGVGTGTGLEVTVPVPLKWQSML